MKKRVNWIDIAKCFGIFAIYLGHCGSVAGKLNTFVWTHHVALFFVLAGFTESMSSEERFSKYLWKYGRDFERIGKSSGCGALHDAHNNNF